jgi:hypothetical protein
MKYALCAAMMVGGVAFSAMIAEAMGRMAR